MRSRDQGNYSPHHAVCGEVPKRTPAWKMKEAMAGHGNPLKLSNRIRFFFLKKPSGRFLPEDGTQTTKLLIH